jgi:hypothetical protein
MNQRKPTQWILAWMLSIGMALGITLLTVMAETMLLGASGEIIAFEALSEETTNRKVALGASLEDLNLPETLTAAARVATATDAGEPEPAPDEGVGNPDPPPPPKHIGTGHLCAGQLDIRSGI